VPSVELLRLWFVQWVQVELMFLPCSSLRGRTWTIVSWITTPGAIGVPSPSGWIETNLFVRYLQHFVDHMKPSESNPVLVILHGHQSHKSNEAIQFARDNHLHLLTIPPHTSHKLQPLDLTFFGPGLATFTHMRF